MSGGRRKHGYRELVRRVLRTESALREYRPPERREGPPEPKNADEVLAALASRYSPGDAVGLQQVLDVIDVTWDHARAVRLWAQHHGAWPYVRPGPCRPPSARSGRKGGEP